MRRRYLLWRRNPLPDTAWYCRSCGREYTLGHPWWCPVGWIDWIRYQVRLGIIGFWQGWNREKYKEKK